MNGIIIINKPRGFTSHDVVAKLRGILKQKRIGHTGTLDPEAEGVLPVCVGNATKVCDYLMDQTKEYIAGCKLGITTDTQDCFGTVLSENVVSVTEEELLEATRHFIGRISQLTPMYSARKVNGQKLYDLARKGLTVERPKKDVTIFDIELLDFDSSENTFHIKVRCEKGTYIRTICNDIGEYLGCGACMTSLVRTATGGFTLEQAHSLQEVQAAADDGTVNELSIQVDTLFPEYSACTVDEEGRKLLWNGNPLRKAHLTPCDTTTRVGLSECIRVYDNETFLALYQRKENGLYYPQQMFLPEGGSKQ